AGWIGLPRERRPRTRHARGERGRRAAPPAGGGGALLPLLRGRGGASWHRWRYPFTRRTPLLTETDYNPFTLAAERKILNPAPILWVIGLAVIAVLPPILGNNSFVLASTSFAMY